MNAKAMLKLKLTGLAHAVEVRPRPGQYSGVELELVRHDCHQGPSVHMSLDDARLFLRRLQGAVDEAYRREKETFEAAARELQP